MSEWAIRRTAAQAGLVSGRSLEPVLFHFGAQNAHTVVVREKFYGLLKEYLTVLRDRDLCEEQVRVASEGIEREEVNRKLELARKRCASLRREIRRYPDINPPPRTGASK